MKRKPEPVYVDTRSASFVEDVVISQEVRDSLGVWLSPDQVEQLTDRLQAAPMRLAALDEDATPEQEVAQLEAIGVACNGLSQMLNGPAPQTLAAIARVFGASGKALEAFIETLAVLEGQCSIEAEKVNLGAPKKVKVALFLVDDVREVACSETLPISDSPNSVFFKICKLVFAVMEQGSPAHAIRVYMERTKASRPRPLPRTAVRREGEQLYDEERARFDHSQHNPFNLPRVSKRSMNRALDQQTST